MLYAWFGAMHTRVDAALISTESEDVLLETVAETRKRINSIETAANCFDAQSELSAVNRMAAERIMPVSRELESILRECLRYNVMTDGLFDITVGSDGYDNRMVRDIILPGDGTVVFRRRGLYINLSGFLKKSLLLCSSGSTSTKTRKSYPSQRSGWRQYDPSTRMTGVRGTKQESRSLFSRQE